jgi:hypothetical protein
MKYSFWLQSGLILAGQCGVILIAMVINPSSASKFWGILPDPFPQSTPSLSYYWDIQAYAELAIHQICAAFYPLWPSLIRWIFHPETIYEAGRYFLISATVLNLLSIPLSLWILRRILGNSSLAFTIAVLYHFSPFSIFRFIGYTESLFSFLSLCLIGLLGQLSGCNKSSAQWLQQSIHWILLGLTIVLLSLIRPTLIQCLGAVLGTGLSLGFIHYINNRDTIKENLESSLINNLKNKFYSVIFSKKSYKFVLKMSLLITISAIIGYSLYGIFCWRTTGDFFSPFSQQKLWNKSLGIRPWLLFTSRSPLVDLLGLYFPLLLWGMAWGQMGQTWGYISLAPLRGRKWSWLLTLYPPLWIIVQTIARKFLLPGSGITLKIPAWATAYEFWFSLYFAAAHSAICFLTQDRLISLGRYVFAQPFIFLAWGYLYPYIHPSHQKIVFPACTVISLVWLVDQWVRYGDNLWLG